MEARGICISKSQASQYEDCREVPEGKSCVRRDKYEIDITENGSLLYFNSTGDKILESNNLECNEGVMGNGFKYSEVYDFDQYLFITKLKWRCQSEGGMSYIILEKETGEEREFYLYNVFLTQFSKDELFEGVDVGMRFVEVKNGIFVIEIWDLADDHISEWQYDIWQPKDFLASEEEWQKVGIKSATIEIPFSDLENY